MATWTDIDHIKITIDYTPPVEDSVVPLTIKTVVPSDDSLRIKTITVEDCTPYVNCTNKDDSLLSLFKRCIITLADGTYALQVNYI